MANYPPIPHRACCSGTVSGSVLAPYDQFRKSETGFPVWVNVSKRYDYHDEDRFNPAGTPPYERYHQNHPGEESCIPADVFCKTDLDAPPNTPYCEFPYTPDIDTHPINWIVAPTGDATFSQGAFNNDFVKTTGLIDYAQCRKIGFKNVFARKAWHGHFPFTSPTYGGDTYFSWCCFCDYQGETPSADTTKYLGMTGWAHYETTDHTLDGDVLVTADASASTYVDRYNGGITARCSASSNNAPDGYDVFFKNVALTALASANTSNADIQHEYCAAIIGHDDLEGLWGIYGDPDIDDGGDDVSYTLTFKGPITFAGADDPTIVTMAVLSIEEGRSKTLDKYGLNPDGTAMVNIYHEERSVSDTHYHYYLEAAGGTVVDGAIFKEQVEVDLVGPYTYNDVKDDLYTLLDQWRLQDDRRYPWRTDARVTFGPLVTYNEITNVPLIPACAPDDDAGVSVSGVDPYSLYDGSILGKPHDFDGAHFWDDAYEIVKKKTVAECASEGADVLDDVYYTEGYGQSSPLGGVHMTQWVGLYDELNTFAQYGQLHFDGEYLYGGKYAEVIVKRPSANWARPCANDRWQINPPDSFCISGLESGTLTIESFNVTPPSWGSFVGYVCNNGVWNFSQTSDFTFHLDSQVITQEQLNVLGASPLNDESCGLGQLSRLRWNYNAIPALCQPVDIIGATATNPIVVTTRQPVTLVSGDRIRVIGVAGITGINSTWTISGVDAWNFGLIGSMGSGQGKYISGGYLKTIWGAEPLWNDTQSKGDYVMKEWYTNARDVGEFQRVSGYNDQLITRPQCDFSDPENLHYCDPMSIPPNPRVNQAYQGLDQRVTSVTCKTYCLPIVPCYPSVVCISPNSGDAFPNGRRFPFPSAFPLDSYGSEWRMEVNQDMPDPFYETPPCPCIQKTDFDEDDEPILTYRKHVGCQQDDGSCQQDIMTVNPETFDVELQAKIYPYGPRVEARCAPPDGAPLPPSGVYLGCLTTGDLNTTAPVFGNVCNYIRPGVPRFLPWAIYLNQIGCVCGTGRFAGDYTANKVFCADNKFGII